MLHPDLLAANDAGALPSGYADWSLQDQISDAVLRIRAEHRRRVSGIPDTNQTESESLRDYFAVLLRPYGLRVSRAPNWRGERWT